MNQLQQQLPQILQNLHPIFLLNKSYSLFPSLLVILPVPTLLPKMLVLGLCLRLIHRVLFKCFAIIFMVGIPSSQIFGLEKTFSTEHSLKT
jgi:hypothetical protein